MTNQYKQLIISKDNNYYLKEVCMVFFKVNLIPFFFSLVKFKNLILYSHLGTTLWENKQDNISFKGKTGPRFVR